MNDSSIVVARPGSPRELILVFHGVGSSAANLVPLARLVAQERPAAMVVSVDAPPSASFSGGREWFSVVGITEANRPARIAAAFPAFADAIRAWQGEAGVSSASTVLIGFSQGAIMSLESTQVADLARRIISISGRFAEPPRRAPTGVTFRFVHGEQDSVIDSRFSLEAAATLRSMGADVAVYLVPDLGHGIDDRAARMVIESLR
jgi:phospholipase/carboxylesterase